MVHRLNYAIRRSAGDSERWRRISYRLMVKGVHHHFINSQQLGERIGSGLELDAVRDIVLGVSIVVLSMLNCVGNIVRDVLVKGPAEGDIHDLDSAANGERWQISLQRGFHEFDLGDIAQLVDETSRSVPRIAGEERRVYVAAATQDEAIQRIQRFGGVIARCW